MLDVPYAVVIGIFAGIANIVPYFGPVAGAIPAIIIKSIETSDAASLIAVGVLFLIVQALDNVWVKPHVFSRSMNMHPLVVFLVVIAGGELAGIMGMILSIPVTASLGVILREFYRGIKNYQFQG
ncbi:MAG: AI-2E family transporter [bacterium]